VFVLTLSDASQRSQSRKHRVQSLPAIFGAALFLFKEQLLNVFRVSALLNLTGYEALKPSICLFVDYSFFIVICWNLFWNFERKKKEIKDKRSKKKLDKTEKTQI